VQYAYKHKKAKFEMKNVRAMIQLL